MRADSDLARPDVGAHDAGASDAGASDAGASDAGASDAGASDAGAHDAASVDAAASDAGSDAGAIADAAAHDAGNDAGDAPSFHPPVIDGTVVPSEWAAATSVTSSTVSDWSTSNTLSALHAIATDGTLYLAVEGQVGMFNGMVVYLDVDPGGPLGIASLASLTDTTGALDHVVSAGYVTPAANRWDVAWGTTLMSHSVMGADDTTGFRDITNVPSNFGWIVASAAQTACGATACEAAIPTAMLPGTFPRTIAMFARIASSDGSMSPNQTLPMDDPSMPRVVTVTMTITEM